VGGGPVLIMTRDMPGADDKTALLWWLGKVRLFLRAFALMRESRETVFGGSRIGPLAKWGAVGASGHTLGPWEFKAISSVK
jgi:hypothetical protein